ncbi:MAG TPA: MipA/OmpV family protein [Candidatus Sulfotelmatobacter sp.]|nr:MipA/OmpV family protein [Candidatus Sulfotelmatobacter sp.]
MRFKTTLFLSVSLFFCAPMLASAQDAYGGANAEANTTANTTGGAANTAQSQDWRFLVGAGGMVAPTYEGSEHYHLTAMPLVEASWRSGISLGSRDGLKVVMRPLVDKGFTITTGLGYWLGRKQSADKGHGDALRGLGDVSGSAIGRLGVGYELGAAEIGLDFNRDLGGDRDGATVALKTGYKLYRSPHFRVKAELSATWADDDYMSAMFGITRSQAASSVKHYAAYTASAGIKDVKFGLNADYDLTSSVTAFALAGVARLTGDAADSPIVKSAGDANQYSVGLGLMYHF